MDNYLKFTFEDAKGEDFVMKITRAQKDLTSMEVSDVLDDIVSYGVISNEGQAIVSPIAATYYETIKTDITLS